MNDVVAYAVAVRTLCEFTAKQGDLDLRFTPSPSAQEGMIGHGVVASRRPPPYQTEVSLAGEYKGLKVRGRADGYDPSSHRLEEIKTHRGDLAAMPANHRHLHWAQLKVYGWLMCQERELPAIDLALVYFDIASQTETVLNERHDAATLQAFFEEQCERFLAWAAQEAAHRASRDEQLGVLRFPHDDFRPSQRVLAESVYRAAASGRVLAAQAPTGIGKTIGTLFPMLKACPGQRIDKVFFLTAKTSGRQLALGAAETLRRSAPALPLRVIELVARDKACEYPDRACHGDSCPLARGFYDRLPQARQMAVEAAAAGATLDKATLRGVAAQHGVCPYYLAQDLTRWSDVLVGDYNYYFDLNAMLFGLTLANQWKVGVLIDEAHNLVDRVRGMYSAQLSLEDIRVARSLAPPALRTAFDRVKRQWKTVCKNQEGAYAVYESVPAGVLNALQQASTAMTELLAEQAALIEPALLAVYFDILHFCRLAELFDGDSLCDLTQPEGAAASAARADSTLCLRNVVPAAFVKPRLAAAHSTTLFSATLRPQAYYQDMLGLPADTAWVDVPSPFTANQLSVQVARHVSTRFAHRRQSLAPIVALMSKQYAAAPGNYLAFFSSYDYLEQVANAFAASHPNIPVWSQSRRMDESARDAFLARFTPASSGIGFAVLGGAFAEGIDLPGKRLIGAFIATLGLPQINPVNEQIRERMDRTFASGYDYTYLYPGMQKVVQAAGRVIRSPSDRGVVHLIDDRFGRREIRELLPSWWALDEAEVRVKQAG
ncbi:ATP-dependent DNA helicase [Pigmentiphaga aceris]|uniref:ATP-dependent DNA helicase n=1 Tax=Pigmentiphaga aceris TaxID=1940612 RepID=A0A5C0AXM4_9BURK|nr:ATP-dependent DNA helicase [Pigmentiphaga aceris]QEI07118.1 ATP-dependent DNA helicase [Pigmentiphaga aceris]